MEEYFALCITKKHTFHPDGAIADFLEPDDKRSQIQIRVSGQIKIESPVGCNNAGHGLNFIHPGKDAVYPCIDVITRIQGGDERDRAGDKRRSHGSPLQVLIGTHTRALADTHVIDVHAIGVVERVGRKTEAKPECDCTNAFRNKVGMQLPAWIVSVEFCQGIPAYSVISGHFHSERILLATRGDPRIQILPEPEA